MTLSLLESEGGTAEFDPLVATRQQHLQRKVRRRLLAHEGLGQRRGHEREGDPMRHRKTEVDNVGPREYEQVWTDMRPLGVRKKMEAQASG